MAYKYNVCYVLTDNHELIYYDQLVISISSLRRNDYCGTVYVFVDETTCDIISNIERRDLDDLQVKLVKVDTPKEYTQKEKSRYIKTSLRNIIAGDVLLLDTDTIIADHMPPHVSDSELALVLDANYRLSEVYHSEEDILEDYQHGKWIASVMQQCGYSWDPFSPYYNAGVIWMKDTINVRQFYKAWHAEWIRCRNQYGVTFDQPSLNAQNAIWGNLIEELDGIWNVQVCFPYALRYINNAVIIHYFNRSFKNPYMLSDKQILKKGIKSKEVEAIIDNPKEAFVFDDSQIIRLSNDEVKLLYTSSYGLLKSLSSKHPLLIKSMDRCIRKLSNCKRNLGKLKRHFQRSKR